jgi:hypothetical protein
MLGAVSQLTDDGQLRTPQEIQEALQALLAEAQNLGRPRQYVAVRGIRLANGVIRPAEVAFFVPEIPETLILNRTEGAA